MVTSEGKLVFPDTKMYFKMAEIKSMALASVYRDQWNVIQSLETRHLIWESNM